MSERIKSKMIDGLDGGTSGQVLTKASATDYDFDWDDPSSVDINTRVYETLNTGTDSFGKTVGFSAVTSDATPTRLRPIRANSSSHPIVLDSGDVCTFYAKVQGYGLASNNALVGHFHGAIKNTGGTTSLVGSVVTTMTANELGGSSSITITADDTNDALKIEVVGVVETIFWNGEIDYTIIKLGL